MMKQRILIATVIAIAMVGCSTNEEIQPDIDPSTPDTYEPSTSPISFQDVSNWGTTQTKGFATTEFTFREFGALAYYMKEGEVIDDVTPNFMYNQKVSLSNKIWTYSPVKYWPNNENETVQFFCYYPYNSAEIVLSGNDAKGYPTFTVTPHSSPYDQDDFVVASTEPMSSQDENVSLTFTHKQAQARIYAAHNGKEATLQVLSIVASGFRASGELIYIDDIEGDDKFVWKHQYNTKESEPEEDEKATYTFTDAELSPLVEVPYLETATTDYEDYTALGYGGGESYMMLIPQDVIGDLHFTVLFSYQLTDGSKAQSFQKFILPAEYGSTLKEGEIKIYLLHIDPNSVGFGSINVTSIPLTEVEISNGDSGDGTGDGDGSFTIE